MNIKYVFFIYLISKIFCYEHLGKNDEIEIYPQSKDGYIYLNLYEFSYDDNIYLKLKIPKDGEISSILEIAYTNYEKIDTKLNFIKISDFAGFSYTNSKGYYFSLDYADYKYMIIKYLGYKRGYSDNYIIFSTSGTHPLVIIFSIVGSVIVAILIFFFVLIKCCCKKKEGINMPVPEQTYDVDPLCDPSQRETGIYYPPANQTPHIYDDNIGQQYYPAPPVSEQNNYA